MRILLALLAFVRRLCRGPVRRTICKVNRARLGLERLETKDVPSGTWTQVTALPAGASVGPLMLMANGQALAPGGAQGSLSYLLSPDSSGNYSDGTWATAAPLGLARGDYASNIDTTGNYVVVGGEHTMLDNGVDFSFTATAESYNLTANAWTATANFPFVGPPVADGTFLGGGPAPTELIQGSTGPQILTGYFWGPYTELLDPATGQWATGPNRFDGIANASGEGGWVQIAGGRIVAYDNNRTEIQASQGVSPPFAGDLYSPTSGGQWLDASTIDSSISSDPGFQLGVYNGANEIGPGLLLPPTTAYPNGRVFWLGANGNAAFFTQSSTSAR